MAVMKQVCVWHSADTSHEFRCVIEPKWGFCLLYLTEPSAIRGRIPVLGDPSLRPLIHYACTDHLGAAIEAWHPTLREDNVPLRVWALFARVRPDGMHVRRACCNRWS